MFEDLSDAKMICIDLETFDPNLKAQGPGSFRNDGYVVGIAIKPLGGQASYYPIAHSNANNLGLNTVKDYMNSVLGTDIPKVGAHILYDLEWLRWLGVKVRGIKYDVLVAEPLIDENRFQYNLQGISQRRLGEGKVNDEILHLAQRIDSKIKTHGDVFKVLPKLPIEAVATYACGDVDLTLKIFLLQIEELKEQGLWEVFILESELIDCLLDMRIQGVPVDVRKAEEVRDDLIKREAVLQRDLKIVAGSDVQIWAAENIARVFDKAGIKYPLTAKTKKPSFTAPWLEAHPSELAKMIIQTRRVSKMRNDFVENMVLGSAINGRIHPQFHSVKHDEGGTVSGRFSSSNPNLQQVPARDPVYGPLIRGMFVPDPGTKWCKGDYSQQEPRITVHYARVKGFRGAEEAAQRYIDNPATDYHQMVADMCGIERGPAKNINLGLAYGMGIAKMAVQLGKSENETRVLFKKYHEGVPFVKLLGESCLSTATTRGYIRTLLGRRRRFDLWGPTEYDPQNLRPSLPYDEAVEKYGLPLRRAFTHKALNALIQGSGADMLKKALLDVYKAGFIPYLTVHDEIDVAVTSQQEAEWIRDVMLATGIELNLSIPLKVDLFVENSWGECK